MADKGLNIMLLAGIVLLAGGIAGAGLTYRSMRIENLTHARTGEVSVPFADTQASRSAGFRPYNPGLYRLYIGPPETGGDRCNAEAVAADLARLGGIIDVTVSEPGGDVVLSTGTGPGGGGLRREANGWLLLDSLRIDTRSDSAWTLGVSWCPGSPFGPSCAWAVFLLPPQEYAIGDFLEGGIFRMMAFAGLSIAGFLLIVIGGRKR